MRNEDALALGAAAGAGYRLAHPRAATGGDAGNFSGARDGQSADFHDYREYVPGDDLRRVDWRAYARSAANGQMHVKLFREEVSSVVEVHLDTSASMGAYGGKAEAAVFLAAFLMGAARAAEAKPVLCRDGMRFGGEEFLPALAAARFGGAGLPERPARAARRAVRFFLSDYLFGGGVPALLARQAAGSLACTPVMVLAESELRPPWRGAVRLRDVENEAEHLDAVIGEAEVAAYQRRLAAHRDAVASFARAGGGRLVAVEAADRAAAGPEDGRFRAFADVLARERVVTLC